MQQPESTPTSVASSVNKGGWSTFRDYCLKNPFLVLWNVALILGGLITFTHFASIKYFPDLDIKTASSFLLGIALLGVTFVSVLAVVLLVPSYLIRTEVWRPYYLHCRAVTGQQAERVSDDIAKKRRLPFMRLSLFHGLTALFFWLFFGSFFIASEHVQYRECLRAVSLAGFALSVAALLTINVSWSKRKTLDGLASDDRYGHSQAGQNFTFLFIWWILYPGYFLLLVLSVGNLNQNDIAGHLIVLSFAVVLIGVNSGLAVTDFSSPRSLWKIPAMAALLTAFYLSIPSNPLNITRAVFASLAIGDLGSSQFIVKRPTCDAVNLLVPGACEVASDSAGCIRPASLANRLGGEYLLVLKAPMQTRTKSGAEKNKSSTSAEIRVPIPKSEVLVWGSVDSGNISWKGCNTASNGDVKAN